MKRFSIACLLTMLLLNGCNNPISSAVDKEGNETRAEMQIELAAAKVELTEEIKRQLDQLYIDVSGQMVNLLQYFSINGGRL